MSLLKVENLKIHFHTRYGITRAVDGINFDLEQGKTLGIVGESGSGKSVACLSLLGLLPTPPARIEDGTALFDGIDLLHTSETEMRRIRGNRISMIFQDPMTSLNPYLTIETQLLEPLKIHMNLSRKTARDRAITMLEEVGIPDPRQRLKSYPHEFSGGMRQRVMIAMALSTEPDIIIADEPTTALDVTIQAQILELIKSLQKKYGIATIFVTHDLGLISGIADYMLVMHDGAAVEQGHPDDIFQHTKHPYTKKLIQSIPHTGKTSGPPVDYATSDRPYLKIEKVKVAFPSYTGGLFSGKRQEFTAVDEVSLALRKSEILGLVGESGSGKSTLARSIVRLVNVSSGNITLENRILTELEGNELNAARPEFQMIFQDPYASLNPRMTVYDCLAEALRRRRKISRDTLLAEVLRLMQDVSLLPDHIRKYPHEFSGGQRQRIAIARALALQPKLIIADEPVSALDVTVQAQILDLLLNINKKYHTSMIFISHDLSVIRYIADRTAVMYQGKLVELGDTETVFNHPKHPYTKTLLSAIRINKLVFE